MCTRESDQLTVSDQRCDRIPQPEPVTEPCSTECELRCTLLSRVYTLHRIFIVYSSFLSLLAIIPFLTRIRFEKRKGLAVASLSTKRD